MKKHVFRNRRMRYGGMTVLLTVLVITVTVLFNAVFSTLAERHQWYTYSVKEIDYRVTEASYGILADAFAEAKEAGREDRVRVLFCDLDTNVVANETLRYVYMTATLLAEQFPEHIAVECHDIWSDPTSVRPYTKTVDPVTGEETESAITSTCVILVAGDYYRVYTLQEFYVFKEGDANQLWAYNGEKKLTAGLLRAVGERKANAYIITNHGETFYDYEMLYLLDDAGYRISYIDLYKEKIPADCDLLVSYNPTADLAHDGLSAVSEVEVLEEYLSDDGKQLMVFLGNASPSLPNLEAFLSEWGFAFDYATDTVGGGTYRYMIQDAAQSLTSDGYTIYGDAVLRGPSGELLAGLSRSNVFKNATSMHAAQGYVSQGESGSYQKGDRTLLSLYEAGESSVAWANGRAVADGDGRMLLGVTEQSRGGATSRVAVASSCEFAAESFLQSAVYGNTDTLLRLCRVFGMEHLPEGLTIKPFDTASISMITTSQMLAWTLTLTLTPAILLTVIAAVVLIKRRRA